MRGCWFTLGEAGAIQHSETKLSGGAAPEDVGLADQLRRKAVADVERFGRARHASLIPDPRTSGNPTHRQLDDVLQVRCAVFNGKFGPDFRQLFDTNLVGSQ
jgi:hypothetical protein